MANPFQTFHSVSTEFVPNYGSTVSSSNPFLDNFHHVSNGNQFETLDATGCDTPSKSHYNPFMDNTYSDMANSTTPLLKNSNQPAMSAVSEGDLWLDRTTKWVKENNAQQYDIYAPQPASLDISVNGAQYQKPPLMERSPPQYVLTHYGQEHPTPQYVQTFPYGQEYSNLAP